MVIIALALLSVPASLTWRIIGTDGKAWQRIIASDGEGYHAYLDNLIARGHLHQPRARPDHLTPTEGGAVIKYPAGVALLQAPLTAVAHGWQVFSSGPLDGRSAHYQLAVLLSGLLFLALGLIMVRKLLLDMGFTDAAVAITMCALYFGTGIAFYGIITPSLSHVYSFATISGFVVQVHRLINRPHRRSLLYAAALFGIVVLLRPVNALALLAVPMMAAFQPASFRGALRVVGWRGLLLAGAITMSIVAIQPLLWYWQSGAWWVRPYAGEGFYWTSPALWKSALGAQKGLFFHWPVLLLAAPGMVLLFRRDRITAWLLTVFFVLLLWITSAWWNWLYGDSYGPRPYLDHLIFFAWPMAILFDRVGRTTLRWAVLLIAPLLALQTLHAWQYQAGLIHPFNMDMEKWRFVALRTDPSLKGMLGGNFEPAPFSPNGLLALDHVAIPGPQRIAMDSPLRTAFTPPAGNELYVEMDLRRKAVELGDTKDAIVECLLLHADRTRITYWFRLNDQPLPDDRQWRHWRYAFRMPAAVEGEELVIRIRQPFRGTFHVRDVNVKLSAVKPY